MQPDDKGTSDFIAVLISRKPLNYEEIKTRANEVKAPDFAVSMESALQNSLLRNIVFRNNESVSFTADYKDEKSVLIVIEVIK